MWKVSEKKGAFSLWRRWRTWEIYGLLRSTRWLSFHSLSVCPARIRKRKKSLLTLSCSFWVLQLATLATLIPSRQKKWKVYDSLLIFTNKVNWTLFPTFSSNFQSHSVIVEKNYREERYGGKEQRRGERASWLEGKMKIGGLSWSRILRYEYLIIHTPSMERLGGRSTVWGNE